MSANKLVALFWCLLLWFFYDLHLPYRNNCLHFCVPVCLFQATHTIELFPFLPMLYRGYVSARFPVLYSLNINGKKYIVLSVGVFRPFVIFGDSTESAWHLV